MKPYYIVIIAEEVDMGNTLRLCAAACGSRPDIAVFDTLADLARARKGVDPIDVCPLCAGALRDTGGEESVMQIVACVRCESVFYITEIGLESREEDDDE